MEDIVNSTVQIRGAFRTMVPSLAQWGIPLTMCPGSGPEVSHNPSSTAGLFFSHPTDHITHPSQCHGHFLHQTRLKNISVRFSITNFHLHQLPSPAILNIATSFKFRSSGNNQLIPTSNLKRKKNVPTLHFISGWCRFFTDQSLKMTSFLKKEENAFGMGLIIMHIYHFMHLSPQPSLNALHSSLNWQKTILAWDLQIPLPISILSWNHLASLQRQLVTKSDR